MTSTPLLEVSDLRVALPRRGRTIDIIQGVDLQVAAGQIIGLAGESGSGKTVTALSLVGLGPEGADVEGSVRLNGTEVLALSARALQRIRGHEIGVVFQDPMTSLHPMLTVGTQLTEHVRVHLGIRRGEARRRAVQLLTDVRLPDPEQALQALPHRFSGGMRQRIAIAMALACDPHLLIADEPTTALDVTVQAGVLRLLVDLRDRLGLGVLLITHDLAVLGSLADEVNVMYAGNIVERGAASEVLRRPRHPYTRGLLAALPSAGATEEGRHPLVPLEGATPDPTARPTGCHFHPRCGFATRGCSERAQHLVSVAPGRQVACEIDPFRVRGD